jgi:hypothetical protein
MVRITFAFPPGYRALAGADPGVSVRADGVPAVVAVPEPPPEVNHTALAAPATVTVIVSTRTRTATGVRNRRFGTGLFLLAVTVIGSPGGLVERENGRMAASALEC